VVPRVVVRVSGPDVVEAEEEVVVPLMLVLMLLLPVLTSEVEDGTEELLSGPLMLRVDKVVVSVTEGSEPVPHVLVVVLE